WLGYTLTSFLVVPLAAIFFALGFSVRSFYFGGIKPAALGESLLSRPLPPPRAAALSPRAHVPEASGDPTGPPWIEALARPTEPDRAGTAVRSEGLRGGNASWREEFDRIFIALDSADRDSPKQG